MRSIRQRRTATAAALLAVVALVAAGCGGSDSSGDTASGGQDAPGADALDKATGVTKVTFWHGMKGANGEAVDKLVKAFNAEHTGKIEVTAVYQGDYDETITRGLQVMDQSAFMLARDYNLPIHVFDVDSTGSMRAIALGEDRGTIITRVDEPSTTP